MPELHKPKERAPGGARGYPETPRGARRYLGGPRSLPARCCAGLMLGVIRIYWYTLSPLIGGQCRFEPTCSRYADEAIRRHGPWAGARLSVRRILRCHPFGGSGLDLVPDDPCRRTR